MQSSGCCEFEALIFTVPSVVGTLRLPVMSDKCTLVPPSPPPALSNTLGSTVQFAILTEVPIVNVRIRVKGDSP